jgi:hypothetical protein
MTGFHSKQDMSAGKQKEYDPCIGCLVGTVCRTPNCGRLKLPVDHPFRNTKAALIASITACRDMLDAQPVPARDHYDQTALELCNLCGWKTLIPDDGCLNCERASPAQEPVAHVYLFDHEGRPRVAWDNAKGVQIGDKLYTAPPQRQWIWLSDADIAEVVDTTCQYTGSYEEYLIKKAERKIRSMNHG